MLCATSHSCSEATQAPLTPALALDPRPTLVSLPRAQRVQTVSSFCLPALPAVLGWPGVLVWLLPPH